MRAARDAERTAFPLSKHGDGTFTDVSQQAGITKATKATA